MTGRIALNNSRFIPNLMYGTASCCPLTAGMTDWAERVEKLTYQALKLGYRGIDTAYAYLNEQQVGFGIQNALNDKLVKREDVFVSTKIWMHQYRPEQVHRAVNASLDKLQLDYVDLILFHWPVALEYHGDDQLLPRSDKSIGTLVGIRMVDNDLTSTNRNL